MAQRHEGTQMGMAHTHMARAWSRSPASPLHHLDSVHSQSWSQSCEGLAINLSTLSPRPPHPILIVSQPTESKVCLFLQETI